LDYKNILNKYGVIARDEWVKIAQIRKNVQLDRFIIMPDHMHGILIIKNVGATGSVAHKTSEVKSVAYLEPHIKTLEEISIKPDSLGSIIGQYKSMVTKNIRKLGLYDFHWQRNYYDRIIRSKPELFAIRRYIADNPMKHQ